MIDGIFRNPTPIYFGHSSTQMALEEMIPDQSKVLIVHGKHSAKETGALDHAIAALDERNIPYLCLGGVRPNPVAEQVYQGITLCRQHNISFILAIGGGSVIDTAKSIAIGTPYQGDFFDFYSLKIVPTQSLPIGTVLTIAGAG
nr:iron-containing alcohol dehydrogenase [Dechloromonas sp.]